MSVKNPWNGLKFVTGNPNKVREVREILGIDIVSVNPGELMEVQTSDVSMLIEHKALQAYKFVKGELLVEDSGLLFDAWNGLPGALVKWFEQSVGCAGMVKMLSPYENRDALALCCVAIHDGTRVRIARGEIKGRIANEVRGENGFGWDSIFIPDGHERTFGEMSADEKNSLSHRKMAFESLKTML